LQSSPSSKVPLLFFILQYLSFPPPLHALLSPIVLALLLRFFFPFGLFPSPSLSATFIRSDFSFLLLATPAPKSTEGVPALPLFSKKIGLVSPFPDSLLSKNERKLTFPPCGSHHSSPVFASAVFFFFFLLFSSPKMVKDGFSPISRLFDIE